MMKKIIIGLLALATAVGLAVLWRTSGIFVGAPDEPSRRRPSASASAGGDGDVHVRTTALVMAKAKTTRRAKSASNVSKPSLKGISAGLRGKLLQQALDADDVQGVMALAGQAADSADEALRMQAIEALGWYGEEAVEEMMAFLSDPSDRVAGKAYELIDSAIDAMDGSARKSRLVGLAVLSARTEAEATSMLAKLETVDKYFGARELIRIYGRIDPDSALAELVRNEYKFVAEAPLVSVARAKERLRELLHAADGE